MISLMGFSIWRKTADLAHRANFVFGLARPLAYVHSVAGEVFIHPLQREGYYEIHPSPFHGIRSATGPDPVSICTARSSALIFRRVLRAIFIFPLIPTSITTQKLQKAQ